MKRSKTRELGHIAHDSRRVTTAFMRGQHIVGNRLLNPKPARTVHVEVKIGRTAPDFSSARGFFAGPKESDFYAVACIRDSIHRVAARLPKLPVERVKDKARCGVGQAKSPTEANSLALQDLGEKISHR